MSDSLLKLAVIAQGAERVFAALTPEQRRQLLYEWWAFARPEQLEPPGDWNTWLILAGRAWGKSRVGAETVRGWALAHPGCKIALVARTTADVRDVMVRAIMTPWRGGALRETPRAEPSNRMIRWSNGSFAITYSAEEPNALRGPQHDFAWADELAAWQYPDEAWHEGLKMGLRGSGEPGVNIERPRLIVTTTPRPIQIIRDLLKLSTTHVTRGSTFDNEDNLPKGYLDEMKDRYMGTRLGRQELFAEVLEDTPGALWTMKSIDDARMLETAVLPDMARVVVAVDPSGGHGDSNDEQGITVQGRGVDGRGYVMADLSCKLTPDGWGTRAVQAYVDHQADCIIYEQNFGGEMCEHVLLTAARSMGVHITTKEVHASRGKAQRAEPIAALYEQGKCSHVGYFKELEEEMCSFVPGKLEKSPNRADAMVWGFSELMISPVSTMELWEQAGID